MNDKKKKGVLCPALNPPPMPGGLGHVWYEMAPVRLDWLAPADHSLASPHAHVASTVCPKLFGRPAQGGLLNGLWNHDIGIAFGEIAVAVLTPDR